MEILSKAGLICAVLGSIVGILGALEPDKINPAGGIALGVSAIAFIQAASLLRALRRDRAAE